MTHKDNLLAFMTVARMGLFTGLLALASGMNPASGQVPSALLPNATLTASAGSGCVGQDTLTFTLGAFDLDTSEIVSIDWSILLDGAAAPTSSYDLDVAVGGNLNDWSTSIVLSFVPQKSGEFTVIADPIVYTTTQQVGNQASVIVGEAPNMPSYTPFDPLFCEDENLVVLTSLSTPLPIAYSLQWEVVDLGNANVIASNAVVSDPADLVIAENVGVSNLPSGAFELRISTSNFCGDSSLVLPFEVVSNPSFQVSVPPHCDGDTILVASDFDINDYLTPGGFAPDSIIYSWTTTGGAFLDSTLNDATLTDLNQGDVVSEVIGIQYVVNADTLLCGNNASSTANDVAVVHVPAAIQWEVTMPEDYPSVCANETIRIELVNVPTSTSHEWVTSPLPNTLFGGPAAITGEPINDMAEFENVQTPGISGKVVRTTTFADLVQCVNEVDLDTISVTPSPEIAWTSDNGFVVCENDSTTCLGLEIRQAVLPPVELTWTVTDGFGTIVEILTSGPLSTGDTTLLCLDELNLGGAGNFSICVTATNTEGCTSNELCATVQVLGVPQPTAFFDPICEGDEVVPSDVALGGYTYNWDVNGQFYSDLAQPTFTNLACGDQVDLLVTATYFIDPDTLFCGTNSATFFPQVVPLADVSLTSAAPLCKWAELDIVAVNASETQDSIVVDGSCEVSETLYEWSYTPGNGIWYPQLGDPPIFGDTLHIPGDCLEALTIELKSYTSVDSIQGLLCAAVDTLMLDIAPAPVIDSSQVPATLCPNELLTVDAWAQSENPGSLAFDWSSIVPSDVNWDPSDDLANGADFGELDLLYNSNINLQLQLVVTDSEQCTDTATFDVDVFALPNLAGIAIMDPILGDSTQLVCPDLNGTVFSGDTLGVLSATDSLTSFCDLNDFLVVPGGTSGEFGADSLEFTWNAILSSGQSIELVGDSCAYGLIPAIPCQPQYMNAAGDHVSISLTLEETTGCMVQYNWVDTLEVFARPCIEVSSTDYCNGSDWETEVCGPQFGWACDPSAVTWDAPNTPNCADIVVPANCNTLYGCSVFNGLTVDSLTCCNEETFTLLPRNPISANISSTDDSGDANDAIVCQGGSITFDSGITANPGFEWIKDGVTVGNGNTLEFTNLQPEDPCTKATDCAGILEVNRTFPSGLICTTVSDWQVTILPTPTFEWAAEPDLIACEGETIEICANQICGADSIGVDANDFSWSTSSNCAPFASSLAYDTCWSIDAVFNGEPGDGVDVQTKTITLTDAYGCASADSLEFAVHELPEINIEGEPVCADEVLELTVSGADGYDWSIPFVEDTVGIDTTLYWPNYAITGDSVQSLLFEVSLACDSFVTAVGHIFYDLTDTILVCSADDSYNCVVFDLPVIEADFDPNTMLCEGDVIVFEDEGPSNFTVPNWEVSRTYWDYFTTSGLDVVGMAGTYNPSVTFDVQIESTQFIATKYELNIIQGDTTVCQSLFDTLFVPTENPIIDVDWTEGICQNDTGLVSVEILNKDSSLNYDYLWFNPEFTDVSAYAFEEGEMHPEYITPIDSSLFLPPISDSDSAFKDGMLNPFPSPYMGLSVAVRNDSMCYSDTVQVVLAVKAVPMPYALDSLNDAGCSPFINCMTAGLYNLELDPAIGVEYFWNNEGGSASSTHCSEFENNTECPIVDYTEAVVRFEHTLDSGALLYCENDLKDSTIVNPTPSPAFSIDPPQACWDPSDEGIHNCVPVVHMPEQYEICPDDAWAYQWLVTPQDPLTINDVNLDGLNSINPTICLEEPGVVCVVVEATNTHLCAQSSPTKCFEIHARPIPQLTFPQTNICIDSVDNMLADVSIINSSIGVSDYTLEIPGFPVFQNFASPLDLDVEFPGFYNADFYVSTNHFIYDDDGVLIHELMCDAEISYDQAFEAWYAPVADFTVYPDTVVDYLNPVVEFENLSIGQNNNIWSFGNGQGSGELDASHEYSATGVYNVQLLIANDKGCTDVHSQSIEVATGLTLYVPNSFTPNGDGLNDAWKPEILGDHLISSYDCAVYNRTGHKVFHSTIPGEAWDGTWDPALGGSGDYFVGGADTFVWQIRIKKRDGRGAEEYEGHIQMVR